MPVIPDDTPPISSTIRNGLYLGASFAVYLGLSRLVGLASSSNLINSIFSNLFSPVIAAIMLAAIFAVILSPIWIIFFIPRRLLPDGEATFFMLGVCNAVLPAIPAFSGWVLWQYL